MLQLFALFVIAAGAGQELSNAERGAITIISTSNTTPALQTNIDAGPAEGDILNAHYFPGLLDYGAGRYRDAEGQMTYFLHPDRARYLSENLRRSEFFSTAHYIRGMIFAYHATGVGRHRQARIDFEAAIKWNPRHYVAYLELSRIYSQLGLKEAAMKVVHILLDLKPEAEIVADAKAELKALGAEPNP